MPDNIIKRELLVTDLSQQLKKQRDFLRWMGRRHKVSNPEQSDAFFTGARLFDELRQDLLQGLFNAGQVAELFTREREDQAVSDGQDMVDLDVLDRRTAAEEAAAPQEDPLDGATDQEMKDLWTEYLADSPADPLVTAAELQEAAIQIAATEAARRLKEKNS
jgi:hypothetical protein